MVENVRYYAFIRAINTGGRRLTNDEVIAPFLDLGLEEVVAYQAAGNVTFVTEKDDALEHRLDGALRDSYGFDAPTFVRTNDQLRDIADRSPFSSSDLADTGGKVQLTFLRNAPDPALIAAVDDLVPPDDRVVHDGTEWWWLPKVGISDSKLPIPAIERTLGPMTIRTLGTIERMLRKFG
ncbi:MAG: DUF1697 domain-containing protein [Acidimicrobiales bacterium]